MQVSRLTLENFRGSKSADLEFDGHTLLIGGNNVGKSTICEALELALGRTGKGGFLSLRSTTSTTRSTWTRTKIQ